MGLFVNRGRIPMEYETSQMHHTPANEEQSVEGVLMYSERLQSETQSTQYKAGHIRIDCEEFLAKSNLSNTEFAR